MIFRADSMAWREIVLCRSSVVQELRVAVSMLFSSDNVRLLITGEVFVRVKLERRAGPATVIAFALLTERNKFFRIAILLNVLRGRERDDMVREFIHFLSGLLNVLGIRVIFPENYFFRMKRGWNVYQSLVGTSSKEQTFLSFGRIKSSVD